ncbi:MAG: ParB/RepB/Spo0J family partition protein [Candidatus Pacebacteria bacterium]|nr:ParB/RepB/Spo0J family partition protein [Candidatus Paceibacterota bacterium]
MSYQNDNSIYWIEVEKINPNPFQPRREFNHLKLNSLSESIRQYGVLQPLVVTRREEQKEDGGLNTVYELIAGERRLRASKLAGLLQVPVIIHDDDGDDAMRLELAIIENLQREDLNPIDRAKAFARLIKEFNLKHVDVGKKVGKSREYVTNSLRLLVLPEEVMDAVASGQILEGHTRPILMLKDRPQEQMTLYKEIVYKKLSVRDSEKIARRIAYDKIRKKDFIVDPELMEFEETLAESLGTRVQIEKKKTGGKLVIDFFTNDDIKKIVGILKNEIATEKDANVILNNFEKNNPDFIKNEREEILSESDDSFAATQVEEENDEELYSLKDFSL